VVSTRVSTIALVAACARRVCPTPFLVANGRAGELVSDPSAISSCWQPLRQPLVAGAPLDRERVPSNSEAWLAPSVSMNRGTGIVDGPPFRTSAGCMRRCMLALRA